MKFSLLLLTVCLSCRTISGHQSHFHGEVQDNMVLSKDAVDQQQQMEHELHMSHLTDTHGGFHRQPTDEEIKEELVKIAKTHIDSNPSDGKLDQDELKSWLDKNHKALIDETTKRQWKYLQPDYEDLHTWEGYYPQKRQVLTWEKYVNMSYPQDMFDNPEDASDEIIHYRMLYNRAERRWKVADINGNGVLEKDEFTTFIHPEESEHTKEILVSEALEDMDADRNSEVSLDEYMTHVAAAVDQQESSDPSWLDAQQSFFSTVLDLNKDGTLTKDELRKWLLPGLDRHVIEAKKVLSHADENKDGFLSIDEVQADSAALHILLSPEFWTKYNIDLEEVPTEMEHDEF